jgi:DNA-binding NtrC family response regulator
MPVEELPLFPKVLDFVRFSARCSHPVLFYGETGSGKTHLAREIHRCSLRAGRAFVRVNCASIPDSLFEREMFGHVRGAFTDAREAGTGFFEEADGGTLFLDEIGEIPLHVQPKLLAALEEGTFRRLGSPRELQVDVKIVAATNRDLKDMVRQKQFRQDLLYRFSVLQYRVPPLREQREVLPELVSTILRRNIPPGADPPSIDEDIWELIRAYPWPGNIRELENVLRSALVFADGGRIRPAHLPLDFRTWDASPDDTCELRSARKTARRYAAAEEPEEEIHRIREVLDQACGNKTAAARTLGMSRSTLWAKLQRHSARA